MSRLNLNIFIFNLFFLTPEFVFSYDFKVIQPTSVSVQHVNQDQTASISCEHDSYGSKLLDVRLFRFSQNDKQEMQQETLCKKGEDSCKDVTLTETGNSTKFVFTLRNLKPETIRAMYQCEIIVEHQDLDYSKRGINTTLLYASPEVQHVNPVQTASISCESKAAGATIQVARLYRISQNNSEQMIFQTRCEDSCSAAHQCSHSKVVFTIQEVGPEEMKFTYQCEIIVKEKDVVYIETTSYKLRKLQKSENDESALKWIIGLLALYICVITCLYIRLKATVWKNGKACENSTYVVMKASNPQEKRHLPENVKVA